MSKEYLKYLFKSKKGLCVALSLLYLIAYILCFTIDAEAGEMVGLVAISAIFGLFTIITVPIVYSFVHNKKAVDSYFSLPVTRKEIIFTSQLFINLVVAVSFLVLSIASLIIGAYKGHINLYSAYVIYMLVAIVGGIIMTSFTTSLFLEANSLFDGCVLICAYFVLPLVIWLAIETFQEQLIAGFKPLNAGNILSYISLPTALITSEIGYGEALYVNGTELFMVPTSLIISLAWHAGVSVVSLRRNFVERKVERAESISNRFFSYPFVIYAYTFTIVFAITVNEFIGMRIDALIAYFIVFVAFMVANFVYKRKIHIELKDVLFYVGTVAVVLLFSFVAVKTKGFGLSYVYDHNPKNVAINYSNYCYIDEDDDELKEMVLKVEPNMISYNININCLINEKDMSKAKDILDMIEEKRKFAIDQHYDNERVYYSSYLGIITNYDEPIDDFYGIINVDNKDSAYYQFANKLTYKELLMLKDYSRILVEISTDTDWYSMSYDEFMTKYNEVIAQS